MKKYFPLFFCLFLAALLRISWKLYTNYIYDDAYITFRFARNLSNGLGFVYNANQHIYGTTTPLFAILMAVWIRAFPNYLIFGAFLVGLLTSLTSIVLVWRLLDEIQIPDRESLLITGVLVFSDKLLERDMGGMETPVVIFAMMMSYVMLIRNKPIWAGVLAGILLWTRIDGIVWICCLALGAWYVTREFPRKFVAATILVYLPWLVFATFYFGSVIPYTIIAKFTAYKIGMSPIESRAGAVLRAMTPITLLNLSPQITTLAATITIIVALLGVAAYRHHKWLMALPLFCLVEAAHLVVTGETFEGRYFVPLFWVLMILFGLGIHAVYVCFFRRLKLKFLIALAASMVFIFTSLWFSAQVAQLDREKQYFIYDSSLKPLGIWLNNNTPESSVVFLEPLGYAGFYADRPMIDAVGLVSPQVVVLKQMGLDIYASIILLKPDYVVLHCDDALKAPHAFLDLFSKLIEFNPTGFRPNYPGQSAISRNACYQIWKK